MCGQNLKSTSSAVVWNMGFCDYVVQIIIVNIWLRSVVNAEVFDRAVQIVFPDDLSMLAITLTAPPHCSQVSISIPKTRLSLRAQVIDRCFCAPIFSCPVGNACLVLFRLSVLFSRGVDCLVVATPRKPPRTNTP